METKMRKIMVEVTPQEYQKILTGGLGNLEEISTEVLINELLKRSRLCATYHPDIASNTITKEYELGKYHNSEVRLKILGELLSI